MSSPKKKQKKRMLRIAGEKFRYLPEEHELHGNFDFEGTNKERYQAFLHSHIYHSKSINDVALIHLNMFDVVYTLVDNIGWRKFFEINCPSYVELWRNLYATFEFSYDVQDFNLNTPFVCFRLRDKLVHCSYTNFNLHLGVYDHEYIKTTAYLDSLCNYPADWDLNLAYKELIGNPTIEIKAGKSKANEI